MENLSIKAMTLKPIAGKILIQIMANGVITIRIITNLMRLNRLNGKIIQSINLSVINHGKKLLRAQKMVGKLNIIQILEKEVWTNGIEVSSNNNTRIKIQRIDHVVGASNGKETNFIQVKYSNGEIHGQPITEQEFNNRYAKRLKK